MSNIVNTDHNNCSVFLADKLAELADAATGKVAQILRDFMRTVTETTTKEVVHMNTAYQKEVMKAAHAKVMEAIQRFELLSKNLTDSLTQLSSSYQSTVMLAKSILTRCGILVFLGNLLTIAGGFGTVYFKEPEDQQKRYLSAFVGVVGIVMTLLTLKKMFSTAKLLEGNLLKSLGQ